LKIKVPKSAKKCQKTPEKCQKMPIGRLPFKTLQMALSIALYRLIIRITCKYVDVKPKNSLERGTLEISALKRETYHIKSL
jgi:hypothetical protein